MFATPATGPLIAAQATAGIFADIDDPTSLLDTDLNFAAGRYKANGVQLPAMPAGFSRNGAAMDFTPAGVLTTYGTDVPRVQPGSGLLLEPPSTNTHTFSNVLSNAAWIKTGLQALAQVAGPDGATSAWRLANDGSTGSSGVSKDSYGYANNAGYATSAVLKKREDVWAQLTWGSSGGRYCNFDNASILVGNKGSVTTSGMTPYATGWNFCWFVSTAGATSTTPGASVFLTGNADVTTRAPSFAGTPGAGVDVFNIQQENQRYASSPIISGASAATRAADLYAMNSAALGIQASQGAVFLKTTPLYAASEGCLMEVRNAAATERIAFNATPSGVRVLSTSGGVTQASQTYTQATGAQTKLAYSWGPAGAFLKVGDNPTISLPSALTPSALETLYLGSLAAGATPTYSRVPRVGSMRRQPTPTECEAIFSAL